MTQCAELDEKQTCSKTPRTDEELEGWGQTVPHFLTIAGQPNSTRYTREVFSRKLESELADVTHKLKVARESLDAIASWPHSGSNEYRKGEQDPNGYYAHAYYLMEAEIDKARDIARIALSLTGPI